MKLSMVDLKQNCRAYPCMSLILVLYSLMIVRFISEWKVIVCLLCVDWDAAAPWSGAVVEEPLHGGEQATQHLLQTQRGLSEILVS